MPSEPMLVASVSLPAQSAVTDLYKSLNFADAFAIQLPSSASSDPDLLARHILGNQPSWIGYLTKIRDAIVVFFGLKTARHLATLSSDAKTKRIGIFKVYSTSNTEIVLGEDDKHLDFRVSVLCSGKTTSKIGRQLTFSTVVHCHNLLGRAYLWVIPPLHRLVVKASLRRAAHVGWPEA